MNWITFWWESNRVHGLVDSPEAWEKIVACYDKLYLDKLAGAKEAEHGHGRGEAKVPKFGFRVECNGDLTLKDWADANQMILKSVNDT